MKTVVTRGVVAVSVVAALGLTAACGGGDGGDGDGRDGKGHAGGTSSTAQAKPKGPDGGAAEPAPAKPKGPEGDTTGPAPAALTKGDLAKAGLKDYLVSPRKPPAWETASAKAPASPAVCAPLADLLAPVAPSGAKAHVGRQVTANGAATSTTNVELYAYDTPGDAARALKDLRAAAQAERCATFRKGDRRYSGVTARPAPDKGDGAVSYRLGRRVETFVQRLTVTVVRQGATLASFAATNLYDPERAAEGEESRDGGYEGPSLVDKADDVPKVSAALIDAQLAALK
ncbi:hypothetical protein GCM10018785_46620 [Streptomyces longispororuber]|uniref:Lipoprotein n=1 Tax=Streptomyces longispororuber TaxID=68230 RepID=A0A918ZVP6_9ACTN|nr:hypothetical protein [Streptomyces longispororuber]GHE73191.1 hypothetical protein GCM10018785_46620 [Streptomyces longispororuber]